MRTKGEVTSVCYDGSLWVGTSKGVCQNSSVRSPIFTKNAVTSIACIQEVSKRLIMNADIIMYMYMLHQLHVLKK